MEVAFICGFIALCLIWIYVCRVRTIYLAEKKRGEEWTAEWYKSISRRSEK